MAENIREALARQKAAISELSAQIKVLEESDLSVMNRELTERCEKLSVRYEKNEEAKRALTVENAGLKTALYEQYFNEKTGIVTKTQDKLEIYFASATAGGQNRLSAFEADINQRINHIYEALHQNNVDMQSEIYTKLTDLKEEARIKIAQAREKLAESGSLGSAEKAELERLKNEALSGEQIAALSKKNNLERLVGLRVLNTIGIILIIIGVIAAGQFAYIGMSDTLRGIALFALGLVFLVAGEIMNRKRPNIFSLGITAGGVGILYAALAVSYFGLNILNMYAALGICVVITALAFFLSTRYDSQTLLAIALVGGYLPIFSIGPERALLYGMMIYFVLLNLLALSVAFRKKWTVATFVGFGLNLIGTIYIATYIWDANSLYEKITGTVYIAFAMLIYTAIPLISSYTAKIEFKISDVILLTINTFFGSLIMFINVAVIGWYDHLGLTSAIFAVFYLGMGYLTAKKFPGEWLMHALFYITGLTFLVLFVPFQLDTMWFTLGWLIQGTLLTVYGIIKDRRGFRISGFIINGICLFWFVLYDVSNYLIRWWIWADYNIFPWQYLAVTAASILIMAAYIYKKTLYSGLQKTFKYCVTANLWVYAIFLTSRLEIILRDTLPNARLDISYLIAALVCMLTLALAVIIPRIPILLDKGMKIIAAVLNIFGVSYILVLSIISRPVATQVGEQPAGIAIFATLILIAIGALGAFAIYDLTRRAVLDRIIGVQYLPLAVSAFIVIIFTINLINAYGLSFASFWISALYVLTALLWTILGFIKRYALLRRFGLGLALLSVTKLFLVDLATLTQGLRIFSYFTLGVVLVAISYVYQHFSKRMEISAAENSLRGYFPFGKTKGKDAPPDDQ